MYIKRKLKLTYVTILITSFLLIILLSNLFMAFIEDNSKYSASAKFGKGNFAFFIGLVTENNKILQKVSSEVLKNPDNFLDHKYLLQLEKSSNIKYTGIVTIVNNKIDYSSNIIKGYINEDMLYSFNSNDTDQVRNKIIILWKQDFVTSTKDKGSIYYIIDLENYKKLFKENVIIVAVLILIILTATNGIITYFVSKSIVKPIKELDKGAGEILKGNLDYKLDIDSSDEIGEVADTFEEMRLRLKESLEIQKHYEENRKELIASISHDLKTPITSIKGYIEGIKDGVADTPDKMEKYVNTILTKANYMDSLINDLFLYSKLDLNKEPFKFQKVDMNVYIRDCVEEINFDLDQNKVNLKFNVPDTPTLLNIDVQKVKRAIMNIVENSIKYKTDERLIIEIILRRYSSNVILEIKDNGRGIPKEALPYIFERFYRADTSRETTIGGSGLGLAIAKKIMDEHNGEISVDSEANVGTSIFLSFKE
ncbi:HAMP domain-containing sensor histidine kinase [Clostridium manihotivorum]|uniref:histidine kinase n=1 Tax=Clostridium manihotivorum TaxID=2320868 RepID=A0A410DVQ4_9CLOT|nr:HAMP domain-containing sensor histidine kinase [Clostridium manihotivorum]QAA33169.1 two-component sensor histidine kinase [Clostridium manihotivorum]